jgi:uncharacterized membrane protein
MRLVADRDAIERLVTAPRAPRNRLTRAVVGFVTTIVATFVIPLMASGGWRGIAAYVRAEPWAAIGLPLGLAVILTIVTVASTYGTSATDVSRIATQIERDWLRLTDGWWIARVLVSGMLMALVIGIPVGTLIALSARPSELPELGGRVGIVGAFLLMTLLWTVPMAFVIRFLTLRSYRPLLRAEPTNDAEG